MPWKGEVETHRVLSLEKNASSWFNLSVALYDWCPLISQPPLISLSLCSASHCKWLRWKTVVLHWRFWAAWNVNVFVVNSSPETTVDSLRRCRGWTRTRGLTVDGWRMDVWTTLKYLAQKLLDAAVFIKAGRVYSGFACRKSKAQESLNLYASC